MNRFGLSLGTIIFLLITAVSSPPLLSASAISRIDSPTKIHAGADTLLANRLRYRFRVRRSRYSRAGIARGGTCPANDIIQSITPRVVTDETTPDEGSLPTSDNTPTLEKATIYTTAAAHPTFFLYVPSLPATTGELTIELDQSDLPFTERLPLTQRQIYETTFSLSDTAGGIVGIRMPPTAPSLEVGTKYLWKVSLLCSNESEVDGMTLNGGVIERISSAAAAPENQFEYYLEQGIWQEVLAILAEQRFANPAEVSLNTEWRELMEAVGLKEFENASVVEIVNSNLKTR